MFGPRNRTWVAKTVYAQEKKREAKEGARPMTFDWSFVQRYAPFFVNGTLMTLFISVFGILLAIAWVWSALAWKSRVSRSPGKA
mgnify:FL=1